MRQLGTPLATLAATVVLVAACAPSAVLRDDTSYPSQWPRVESLDRDCSGFDGTYQNRGVLINKKGDKAEVLLTDLLLADRLLRLDYHDARSVLIEASARKGIYIDPNYWLKVSDPTGKRASHSLDRCWCNEGAVQCTLFLNRWGGFTAFSGPLGGATQIHYYVGEAADHSFIIRSNPVDVAIIGVIPLWRSDEPVWARFLPSN